MSPPKTQLPRTKRPSPPKRALRSTVGDPMPKPRKRPGPPPRQRVVSVSPEELEALPREQSLLDVVDNLLNQGVVISGEAVLGVADVDLVYLKLSALLCAADKLVR